MSHVVIVSEDRLFGEALADAASRELGVEVTTLESTKTAIPPADVLVTTLAAPPRWEGRVLRYSPGRPRKITALLADIAAQLASKPPAKLALSEVILLHEKPRMLERSDTGTALELTEKEQALLLFIKGQGEVGRDEILKQVWKFAEGVTTHTLETHIYRLRQKWRELADYDCILATDKGYRWYDDNG